MQRKGEVDDTLESVSTLVKRYRGKVDGLECVEIHDRDSDEPARNRAVREIAAFLK